MTGMTPAFKSAALQAGKRATPKRLTNLSGRAAIKTNGISITSSKTKINGSIFLKISLIGLSLL
jgi:hypothetical protein